MIRCVLATASLGFAASGLWSPAAAQARGAKEPATLAFVSEPGDYVGQGRDRLFQGPHVKLRGSAQLIRVTVKEGQESFALEIAPPAETPLRVGEYAYAQRSGAGAKNYPGIDVSGDGRGCNTDYGRFVIEDVAFNPHGKMTRLSALFEQHCENEGAPALFGEVRVGEPAGGAPEAVVPAAVEWPQTEVGDRTDVVPVTITAGAVGTQIASVALQGEDAADFRIVGDPCQGASLAPGGRCEVLLDAKPGAPGTRRAELVIDDASAAQTAVPLSLSTEAPPRLRRRSRKTRHWSANPATGWGPEPIPFSTPLDRSP
jgi:hypothetical protein